MIIYIVQHWTGNWDVLVPTFFGTDSDCREIVGAFTDLAEAQAFCSRRHGESVIDWAVHTGHGRFWRGRPYTIEEFELTGARLKVDRVVAVESALDEAVAAIVKITASAEREECARIAEAACLQIGFGLPDVDVVERTRNAIAAAIRARKSDWA